MLVVERLRIGGVVRAGALGAAAPARPVPDRDGGVVKELREELGPHLEDLGLLRAHGRQLDLKALARGSADARVKVIPREEGLVQRERLLAERAVVAVEELELELHGGVVVAPLVVVRGSIVVEVVWCEHVDHAEPAPHAGLDPVTLGPIGAVLGLVRDAQVDARALEGRYPAEVDLLAVKLWRAVAVVELLL